TGLRRRWCRGSPACGACFPASSAPASSAVRYCLSSLVLDGGVDDPRVEQVDQVLHETVALYHSRGFGAAGAAVRPFEGCGRGTARLARAHANLDRFAEIGGQRRLQLLAVALARKMRHRLWHDQLEFVLGAAFHLRVARELFGGA